VWPQNKCLAVAQTPKMYTIFKPFKNAVYIIIHRTYFAAVWGALTLLVRENPGFGRTADSKILVV